MWGVQVLTVVFLLTGIGAARAADAPSPAGQQDFAASFLLRGGYDTNPEFPAQGQFSTPDGLLETEMAQADASAPEAEPETETAENQPHRWRRRKFPSS